MNWSLLILSLLMEQRCKALRVQNPTKFGAGRKCRLLVSASPGFSTLVFLSFLRDWPWASGWTHQQAATWANSVCVLAWPFPSPNPLWLLPVPSKDRSRATEISLSEPRRAAMERKSEGRGQEKEGKRATPLAVCSPKPYKVSMERGKIVVFSLTAISCCHCSHVPALAWVFMKMVLLGPHGLFSSSKLSQVSLVCVEIVTSCKWFICQQHKRRQEKQSIGKFNAVSLAGFETGMHLPQNNHVFL